MSVKILKAELRALQKQGGRLAAIVAGLPDDAELAYAQATVKRLGMTVEDLEQEVRELRDSRHRLLLKIKELKARP